MFISVLQAQHKDIIYANQRKNQNKGSIFTGLIIAKIIPWCD